VARRNDSVGRIVDDDISNLDPAIQPGHTDGSVADNIFENLVGWKAGTFDRECSPSRGRARRTACAGTSS